MATTMALSERLLVQETARKYYNRGYEVIVEPQQDDLPKFLQNFHPDLVAQGPNDNVVIEVKSRGKVRRVDYWQRLRDVIADTPGWRFELIVNNAPEVEFLSLDEINVLLDKSQEALSLGLVTGAVLTAWSALEASMRTVLEHYNVSVPDYRPDTLVATLQTEGLISNDLYDFLKEMRQKRSAAAHGMRMTISNEEVLHLIEIARDMLDWNEPTS